jgi:hypothetical protein
MDLGFKDRVFIILAINNLIVKYQTRSSLIDDEDEISDLGNDIMMLTALSKKISESNQMRTYMSIESTKTVKRSYAMTNNSKYVVKNTKTNKYYKRGTLEWGNSPNDATTFLNYEDACEVCTYYPDTEVVEYWQALQKYLPEAWEQLRKLNE